MSMSLNTVVKFVLKNYMKDKNIKISIIGLGYVGLPLAVAFAEKFRVIGYDTINHELKSLIMVMIKLLKLEVIY